MFFCVCLKRDSLARWKVYEFGSNISVQIQFPLFPIYVVLDESLSLSEFWAPAWSSGNNNDDDDGGSDDDDGDDDDVRG